MIKYIQNKQKMEDNLKSKLRNPFFVIKNKIIQSHKN
jgi:hypothetical protein